MSSLQWARFHRPLLDWYRANARALPWRDSPDPYTTWVSEIMLQQTQVATVIPYFERWLKQFPNVDSLASAPQEDVLLAWEGLGYYSRARSLHAGAKLVSRLGFPTDVKSWTKIPGVGRYTAGAICSIAQGQRTPVVDANVERVLARWTGCSFAGTALHRRSWVYATEATPERNCGDWNQALMELGALVCKPRKPLCISCPVKSLCFAFLHDQVDALPTVVPKRKPTNLQEVIVIATHRDKIGVTNAAIGEWWTGMTRFEIAPDTTEALNRFDEVFCQTLGQIRYTVTHHRVTATVIQIELQSIDANLTWLTPSEICSTALPAPHRRALKLYVSSPGSTKER